MPDSYRNIPGRLIRPNDTLLLQMRLFEAGSKEKFTRQNFLLRGAPGVQVELVFQTQPSAQRSKILDWNEFLRLIEYLHTLSEGIFNDKSFQTLPLVRATGNLIVDGAGVPEIIESPDDDFKPIRFFETRHLTLLTDPRYLFPPERIPNTNYYWQFSETRFEEKKLELERWLFYEYSIPRDWQLLEKK